MEVSHFSSIDSSKTLHQKCKYDTMMATDLRKCKSLASHQIILKLLSVVGLFYWNVLYSRYTCTCTYMHMILLQVR